MHAQLRRLHAAGWLDGELRPVAGDAVESDLPLTVAGAPASRRLASLRLRLPGWRIRACGPNRALVHSSPAGRTLVIYRGEAFQRVIVTTARSGC